MFVFSTNWPTNLSLINPAIPFVNFRDLSVTSRSRPTDFLLRNMLAGALSAIWTNISRISFPHTLATPLGLGSAKSNRNPVF